MSPAAKLRTVKLYYPELKKLPRTKLRLVEKAILYAVSLEDGDEILTVEEHKQLMKEIGPKERGPASALKAYRFREEMTQSELAKKSGISQANISAMEKGRRPIGLKVAKKLAEILNCNYKRLV